MGRPKKDNVRIQVSVPRDLLPLIDELAEQYTDGDRSAWLVYAATQDVAPALAPKQRRELLKLQRAMVRFAESMGVADE